MGMEKARLTLKIHGRVQGVFFRVETARQARNLGLVGWVRNTPDGTVEVMAEGEKEALDRLHEWCQKGPLFSQVEKAEASWDSYRGGLESFEIIP